MSIETDIWQKALELGFDAAGITSADPIETSHVEYFQGWLEAGYAAKMTYMHRNVEKRFDPGKLLPGAKSVICVALNYRPESGRTAALRKSPLATAAPKLDFVELSRVEASATLRIARFAQYEDYHPFIKERLFKLAEFIQTRADDTEIRFKACVDSVPIGERVLARRAGLGFIGRNHMLIHPELGNQILLGELITTLELTPDQPLENLSCGDCSRCIRACPTGALGFDGSFDARKCISYQTIEAPTGSTGVSPAVVPPSLAATQNDHCRDGTVTNGNDQRNLKNCRLEAGVTCGRNGRAPSAPGYIFGCDECILACPHELGKPERKNKDFHHHPEWQNLSPDQILNMTEANFKKIFVNSGFIRLGLERLKRNVAHISQP